MAARPRPQGRIVRSAPARGKRPPLSEEDNMRLENLRWRSGSTSRKSATRGLACPFLKAFPDTPQWNLNGTCTRHSWPTIPRLKYISPCLSNMKRKKRASTDTNREHLYRCHAQQSFSCPRCVASFEKQKDLDDHLRSQDPCKIANRKDGLQQTINKTQIERLKKRKGLYGQDDVQKWFEIWGILFPTHERPLSPCKCWISSLIIGIVS